MREGVRLAAIENGSVVPIYDGRALNCPNFSPREYCVNVDANHDA
jgi:hypothetical protein